MSAVRDGARPTARRVARSLTMMGMRGVFRVADPVRVACLAARLAPEPAEAAAEMARRVSSLVPPTPAEVVGNYLRGYLLSGREAGPREGGGLYWARYGSRAILTRETAKVPRRLRPVQRRNELKVAFNHDFGEIIRLCQAQHGSSWLTDELIKVYCDVDRLGFGGTVAVYRDGRPVGGFWGTGLGGVLTIMSMFHREDHAGALALAAAAESLSDDGPWSVIDCVELNPNFERYGFTEIPVQAFTGHVLAGLRPGCR